MVPINSMSIRKEHLNIPTAVSLIFFAVNVGYKLKFPH